jgi:hypothetical protein
MGKCMPGSSALKRGQFLVRERNAETAIPTNRNLAQIHDTYGTMVDVQFFSPARKCVAGERQYFGYEVHRRAAINFHDWQVFDDFDSAENYWEGLWS